MQRLKDICVLPKGLLRHVYARTCVHVVMCAWMYACVHVHVCLCMYVLLSVHVCDRVSGISGLWFGI